MRAHPVTRRMRASHCSANLAVSVREIERSKRGLTSIINNVATLFSIGEECIPSVPDVTRCS
jgi:hypothetical protein